MRGRSGAPSCTDRGAPVHKAADVLELAPDLRERLRAPRRSMTVNFPVRMDYGEVRTFTGYRVQHTLTMGPTKGGFRYAPRRLARRVRGAGACG